MFDSQQKKRFTKYLGQWVGNEQAELIVQGYSKYETPTKKSNHERSNLSGSNQNSSKNSACAICLSSNLKRPSTLECGHKFCRECLEGWLENSEHCPCCRQKNQSFICDGSVHKIENLQAMSQIDSESYFSRSNYSNSSSQMSFESSIDLPFCYRCGGVTEPLIRCVACRYLTWHPRCRPDGGSGLCSFCLLSDS